MWRIICLPEETTEEDIANAIFTGNPDLGGEPEVVGIWKTKQTNNPGYPFDIQSNKPIDIGSSPEDEDEDAEEEYESDSDC